MAVKPRRVDEIPLKNMGPVVRDLEPEEERLVHRLDRFQAPYLEEKMLEEEKVAGVSDYTHHFTEFKKYAGLNTISDEPLAMTSPEVDDVWHQFVLFTSEYGKFCREVLGEFLHHHPSTPSSPVPEGSGEAFRKEYKRTFGPLPDVWNGGKEDVGSDSHDCHPPDQCHSNCWVY